MGDDVARVANFIRAPGLGDWHPPHADAEFVTQLADCGLKFFAHLHAGVPERVANRAGHHAAQRAKISLRVP